MVFVARYFDTDSKLISPVVSNIVAGSVLKFTKGLVTNVTDNGFSVQLSGSLTTAGRKSFIFIISRSDIESPSFLCYAAFDALISFPDGVSVTWMGRKIATIALPPICSTGGIGVIDLETSSVLTIFDQAAFTDYATYILLNPEFTWTISTSTLRVEALGTIFENVVLTKDISFAGKFDLILKPDTYLLTVSIYSAFNKLPGVTIFNPDFPGETQDSILLTTTSTIPSLSNLGIDLGTVSFVARFMGEVGKRYFPSSSITRSSVSDGLFRSWTYYG